MADAALRAELWARQARHWARLGAPLRPGPEDGARLEAVARAWAVGHGAPRMLVLGATPEMARLRWPAGTSLVAIDASPTMLRGVWPGFPAPGRGAACGDWLRLPLATAARDLVVSDGCFGVLRFPDQHRELLRAVRGVLREGGRFAFRVFVQRAPREAPAAVFADALAGRIGTFHAFKLRLLMALQPSAREGVRTADALDSWTRDGPGLEAAGARTGWPREAIATIEAYRGQEAVYTFPLLAELRGLFAGAGLAERAASFPSYELGERCPTLELEAVGGPQELSV